jgi:hypothetical protein
MKNYLQRSVLLLLLLAMTGLLTAQTNLLPSGFFDFENEDPDGWWINPASSPYVAISNEQAANGISSLKFNFSDYSTLTDGSTSIAAESAVAAGAKVDLTAGTYSMKVRVYVENNAPSLLKTIFKADWVQVDWDLSGIETGKWVELMQTVTLPNDVVDDGLLVQIFKSTFTGMAGSGAFYVDDIEVFEAVDIDDPLTQIDENYFSFEGGADSWWIQTAHREYAEVNHLSASSGLFSMQYSFEDYSTVYNSVAVMSTSKDIPEGRLELEMGKFYEFRIKIYMEDVPGSTFPSGFETNIKGEGGIGFQNINWNLDDISQRGEWVEKTQTVEYTGGGLSQGEIVSRLMVIRIPGEKFPQTGSGTFRVDDISVVETAPPSLANIEDQTVRVYPNPATDFIYVKDSKGSRVSLYNITGVLVKSDVAKTDLEKISVAGVPSGVYILKVNGGEVNFVKKITIK